MRLSDAVAQYVLDKHTGGLAFERGESNLIAFSRQVGDIDLDQVKTQQVLIYLDRSVTRPITWYLKYRLLFRFFGFWGSRGAMPELLMPPARAKVRQSFVPYVYTRTQIRSLLKATVQCHNSLRSIDRRTFQAFILVLYATGALVSEVLNLNHADINLGAALMTIRSKSFSRTRDIPIGADLHDVLRKYLDWRSRKGYESALLFITKDGLPILNRRANLNFQRLREIAGVLRHDGGTYQPRMDDFRYTFAVHRITSWIKNGADLNRMLPALAAYMGQVGLGSTERYLSMTPERFRKELDKLSPHHRDGHWKSDKNLMGFLANL